MSACHYLISGRVQGVGFRAFTRRKAKKLNLRGWVRNLKDGRVESLAVGEKQNLDQFELILRNGPTHARVDKLEALNCESPKLANELDFILLEDGVDTWPNP